MNIIESLPVARARKCKANSQKPNSVPTQFTNRHWFELNSNQKLLLLLFAGWADPMSIRKQFNFFFLLLFIASRSVLFHVFNSLLNSIKFNLNHFYNLRLTNYLLTLHLRWQICIIVEVDEYERFWAHHQDLLQTFSISTVL